MIFKHLELINFKSHINTSIDFKEGISMIIGENGAGKSSIFEAISFALFKQFTTKKLTDLVRSNKNIENPEKMSVSLTFSCNGIDYKVIREKTKSQSKAKLLRSNLNSFDYSLICEGDKEVNQEIQNILEMDSDLFLNAVYVRQGEIADLVAKTPAERKKLISKLLKLEELEKAWKNSLPLINEYEKRIAELKGLVSSDAELNMELKAKKQEFVILSEKKENLAKELEQLKKLKEDLGEDKAKQIERKAEFENLNAKLDLDTKLLESLKKSKKELQEQVEEITKMEDEKNRLEKYSKKLPIYLRFEESVKVMSNLEKELNAQEELISKINYHKEVLNNKKADYEDYTSLESKLKLLTEEKSKISADLKLINQYNEDKERILSQLESKEEEFSEFINHTKEILGSFIDEDELKSIENDFNFINLRTTTESLKNRIKQDIESNEEKIKELNKELNILGNEVRSSKKPLSELKDVSDKCPICQSEISEDKKDDLIKNYTEIINSGEKRIKEIKIELSKLTTFTKILTSKVQTLDDFEKVIYSNKDLSQNIEDTKKRLDELDKKLNNLKDTEEKIKEYDESIENVNKNRNELKESFNQYIESQGALKSLPKDHEAQEGLYVIKGKISSEVEIIKKAIDSDYYLSTDLTREELTDKINELKVKDQRFNELTGLVRQKTKFTSQLDEKKEEIKVKIIEIESTNRAIKESKYDSERYDKVMLLDESNSNKILNVSNNFSEISGRVKEMVPVIESIEESIKKNKIYKAELKNNEKFLTLLKDIRSLFSKDGVQKTLRNTSRPFIQKHTKEFFEKFNFNYSDLILDENYEISLYGPEGEAKLDMVSGGEKIAIALALRLGITQAISNGAIETILLDEPTIHLDSSRRDELSNLLRDMSVIPQIIVVTHDDNLDSAADQIIKVKKEDGISSVSEEMV